ncbi:MAG: CRISPR-associated helicase Cas3' [Oscillatoriaceae cyanobacterium Prado104]|jgi:CRISPR-associated endonuclease/helicase Cas3|nr:CRISPR-associated helicase Cas3' [Oscillatoriaceae cyanobacterium Prado104]
MKQVNFPRLFAKSLPADFVDRPKQIRETFFLPGHTAAVYRSGEIILCQLLPVILLQLGLKNEWSLPLLKTTLMGCYIHDWGKANQHFLGLMATESVHYKINELDWLKIIKKQLPSNRKHQVDQIIRHEILSAIMVLQIPEFRQWLESCEDVDLLVAVWGAIGHHLKLDPNREFVKTKECGNAPLYVFCQHKATAKPDVKPIRDDFRALLKIGTGSQLKLPPKLPKVKKSNWTPEELTNAVGAVTDECEALAKTIEKNSDRQRFVAAVKATVIAADIAGSAIPQIPNQREWLRKVLQQVLSREEIRQVIDSRLKKQQPRGFQKSVAATKTRITLVKAGCGTGKTIAAYLWGENWAVDRKLFVLYPTTGTATQGFVDYAAKTEVEKALMHSRSNIDLEVCEALINENNDHIENEDRLQSFKTWMAKLITGTVDSVLGLMQNNRKPMYAWIAIVLGAFVFDEVHAYDSKLFSALLRFIQTFKGAPILLMSASFTREQLQKIREVATELGEEITEIAGPKDLEDLPRYQFQVVESSSDVMADVAAALAAKQKVLWVNNSVKSCVATYHYVSGELAKYPNLDFLPLVYHARYRYKDRLKRHEEVMAAFSQQNQGVLVVTNQICEMSLDLSADLLITPFATFAAIIQRLGRLNRKVDFDESGNLILASGCTCKAIFYSPSNRYPYTEEQIKAGKEFVRELAELGEISQTDLMNAALKITGEPIAEFDSIWLDGLWCSHSEPLREGGNTITVILAEDLPEIKKFAEQRRAKKGTSKNKALSEEAQRWAVPVRLPRPISQLQDWKRFQKIYPIAPKNAVIYNEVTGASEQYEN